MDAHIIDRVLERAITLQQIPAPTFAEGRRAAYVKEQFNLEGLQEVTNDTLGNVYGRVAGDGSGPPMVVTAHLDTVFPEDVDLQIKRTRERVKMGIRINNERIDQPISLEIDGFAPP